MRQDVPVFELPVHRWYCPNCDATSVTKELKPHTQYHTCPKLRFMSVPFVAVGTKAKIELNEREDYEAGDMVFKDPEMGRPVMNMITTRDEGTDVRVYAPTATARGGA